MFFLFLKKNDNMKDLQKKQDFYKKTIFNYLTEMYSEDDFLMTLIKRYQEIDEKLIPLLKVTTRAKEIMDRSDEKFTSGIKVGIEERFNEYKLKHEVKDTTNENLFSRVKQIMEKVNSGGITNNIDYDEKNTDIIFPSIVEITVNDDGKVHYELTADVDDELKEVFNETFNNDNIITQNAVDKFITFYNFHLKI